MKQDTTAEAASELTPLAEDAQDDTAGPAASDIAPRRPRSGRGVAYLALLLALAAGAFGGYQYWQGLAHEERIAELLDAAAAASRAAALESTEELHAELARLRQGQERQEQALADARGALADAVAATRTAQPPRPLEWRLAELEHLLRGANLRLVFERDVHGARSLLESAENILAELDDFALHEVRTLVVEDLAALAAYRGADVQSVFLRLEALRGRLRDLPIGLPEFNGPGQAAIPPPTVDSAADENAETSFLAAGLARLKGLVRFRRHEGSGPRPLLSPQEAEYLQQHLLLAVDRAQLAALRRHQAVFDASLSAADEWLAAYADGEQPVVRNLRAELAQLRQADLASEPPDVSRPLARLRSLTRLRQLGNASTPAPAPGANPGDAAAESTPE